MSILIQVAVGLAVIGGCIWAGVLTFNHLQQDYFEHRYGRKFLCPLYYSESEWWQRLHESAR